MHDKVIDDHEYNDTENVDEKENKAIDHHDNNMINHNDDQMNKVVAVAPMVDAHDKQQQEHDIENGMMANIAPGN